MYRCALQLAETDSTGSHAPNPSSSSSLVTGSRSHKVIDKDVSAFLKLYYNPVRNPIMIYHIMLSDHNRSQTYLFIICAVNSSSKLSCASTWHPEVAKEFRTSLLVKMRQRTMAC